MRSVPTTMERIWQSGDYTGNQRPIVRATLQHPSMKLKTYTYRPPASFRRDIYSKAGPYGHNTPNVDTDPMAGFVGYDQPAAPSDKAKVTTPKTGAFGQEVRGEDAPKYPVIERGERNVNPNAGANIGAPPMITNTYADFLWSALQFPRELPNIKSISWSRSLDADVADCTLTMWNTAPLPIGETPVAGVLDQPGFFCADPQTEVLTRDGWRSYDQVRVGDTIYTVNPHTGEAQWMPVLEMFAKHYDGDMVSMESKSISALVTPNHRWVVTNKYRSERGLPYVIKETGDLARYDMIPLARPSADTPTAHSADFAALVGWVITDGTYQKPGDGQRVTINQSATANPDKCEEIRLLLKRLGEPFSERLQGEQVFFRFSGDLALAVRAAAPGKRLTMDFIESLDHAGRTALMDALIAGDGGIQGARTRYFCTSVQSDADAFAALAARLNYSTGTHRRMTGGNVLGGVQMTPIEMFYVNVKTRRHSRVADANLTPVPYSGIVWCPRTENGTFLARRRGKVYFTGNTFNRGAASLAGSDRWKHRKNNWYAQLMPDNIIRTFEGYGFDPAACPEKDSNLVPSGVWIIDDVTMTTEGTIEVKCRDLGRILLEQLLTGPIVPDPFDPLSFEKSDGVFTETINYYEGGGEKIEHKIEYPVTETVGEQKVEQRLAVSIIDTSVSAWRVGTNGSGGPGTVKDPNNYFGHSPHHSIDNDPGTYWLSVGNSSPKAGYAFEWVELNLAGQTCDQVRLRTVKSGYTAYVSLKVNGQWIGGTKILYKEQGIGRNGSNILFWVSAPVPNEDWVFINFPQVAGVEAVRITLGNLQSFPQSNLKYRAAIREIEVWNHRTEAKTVTRTATRIEIEDTKPVLVKTETRPIAIAAGSAPGYYNDYTDIIKLLLAWGGFFWPQSGYQLFSDGTKRRWQPTEPDEGVLGKGTTGAVYGDFQQTATNGKVKIETSNFHMRPIMDGIATIKNILLFNFYFDETGAPQWRQANLTDVGNWFFEHRAEHDGTRPRVGRTRKIYTVDERQVLMSLSARITGNSVREGILTYNPETREGVVTKGYNPNPTGLRRLAGWPNPNYESLAAMKLTGELIAQRQLQVYRQDSITIPGFPGIQIDDQIRIAERITSEGYLHYVKSIECNLDISEGRYEYNISTHWLGEDPETNWWVDTSKMMPTEPRKEGDAPRIEPGRRVVRKALEVGDPELAQTQKTASRRDGAFYYPTGNNPLNPDFVDGVKFPKDGN